MIESDLEDLLNGREMVSEHCEVYMEKCANLEPLSHGLAVLLLHATSKSKANFSEIVMTLEV